MPVNNILSSPDPYVNSVLQSVNQPISGGPGRFRTAMGNIAQGVGNIFMPGAGTAIGSLIRGGAGGFLGGNNILGPEASSFLKFQQQITEEQRAFELASTVLKNRHDAAMSAIRNMKSS